MDIRLPKINELPYCFILPFMQNIFPVQDKVEIEEIYGTKYPSAYPPINTNTITLNIPINIPLSFSSSPQWFERHKINEIEYIGLEDVISTFEETEYIEIRNRMIDLHDSRGKMLTLGCIRKNIAGNFGALIKIFGFLEKWGFVNYRIELLNSINEFREAVRARSSSAESLISEKNTEQSLVADVPANRCKGYGTSTLNYEVSTTAPTQDIGEDKGCDTSECPGVINVEDLLVFFDSKISESGTDANVCISEGVNLDGFSSKTSDNTDISDTTGNTMDDNISKESNPASLVNPHDGTEIPSHLSSDFLCLCGNEPIWVIKEEGSLQGPCKVLLCCGDCINKINYTRKYNFLDIKPHIWNRKEEFLLLEAVDLFGDDWKRVSDHVSTKEAYQCIYHFTKFPIQENYILNLNFNFARPFATAANPVMCLVAFLCSAIHSTVGAVAAKEITRQISAQNRNMVDYGIRAAQSRAIEVVKIESGKLLKLYKIRDEAMCKKIQYKIACIARMYSSIENVRAELERLWKSYFEDEDRE